MRNVLVTGSSHGIGQATAIAFAKEGYAVGINYFHDFEGAVQTEERCKEAGAETKIFYADVSNRDDCKKMLEDFIETFGNIDVLVNNAGGALKMPAGGFDEMPLDYWDSQIGLNLCAAAYCSHYAVKDMKQKKVQGRIINISSGLSIVGWCRRKTLPYCAAKAGVNGLTRTLGTEVAKYGINVNSVAPGFIQTKATTRYSERDLEAYIRKIPAARLGTVDDVTPMILFLADVEKSKFIVGQTFFVDGGESIDNALEHMVDEPI